MASLVKFFLALAFTVAALAGAASAHVATRFFDIKLEKIAAVGDAREISGVLILNNRFKERSFVVQVRIPGAVRKGERVGQDWNSERGSIAPGGNAAIPFRAALYEDGKHIIAIEVLVFNEAGVQIGSQRKNFYVKVEDGKYEVSEYATLYAPPKLDIRTPGKFGGVLGGASSAPVGNEPVVQLIREPALTFDNRKLKLRQLPKAGGSGLNPRVDKPRPPREQLPKPVQPEPRGAVKPVPIELEGAEVETTESADEPKTNPDESAALESNASGLSLAALRDGVGRFVIEAFGVPSAQAATTYNINGKFSYRGLDSALHPGWNWFVEVWWLRNNGNWTLLGSKYINWDGTWSMSLNKSGFSGQNIHVFYRAGGYYLMPRDRNDNPYWWGDPVWSSISTNYGIGHRVADLSPGGALAGLGEAYHSGLLYWWKFYSSNLNPERDSPIRLYFPNTWFNCDDLNWDDDDADPWSCAWEDRVWLLPEHADQFTIQHELSHQLMDEYWNGQRPDGAGGAHTLDACYNDGLALSEGFANAAPVWVLSGENANDPQPGGFSVESPPATTCNGDTNELWVAAIFWDLLDRRSDGGDVLWFNNAPEVFAHVLGNGKKNGVKEYRSIYRNAASSGHQQYIDDIYEHNTVPVP